MLLIDKVSYDWLVFYCCCSRLAGMESQTWFHWSLLEKIHKAQISALTRQLCTGKPNLCVFISH